MLLVLYEAISLLFNSFLVKFFSLTLSTPLSLSKKDSTFERHRSHIIWLIVLDRIIHVTSRTGVSEHKRITVSVR